MKRIIISLALISATSLTQANNFNMPWGNNNNGTNWNMPNMNWGNNGNGFSNGSNWNMPNMNWGNNNGSGTGSNWSMPSMNWGNNNGSGFGNGSNWNMPSMNMGNNGSGPSFGNPSFGTGNNGSNWNMPSMNWGNNNQPWSGAQMPNYTYMPRALVQPQMAAPRMPLAPQFIPRLNTQPQATKPTQQVAPSSTMPKMPMASTMNSTMPKQDSTAGQMPIPAKIPMPSEVKGVILAPANIPKKPEAPKQQ